MKKLIFCLLSICFWTELLVGQQVWIGANVFSIRKPTGGYSRDFCEDPEVGPFQFLKDGIQSRIRFPKNHTVRLRLDWNTGWVDTLHSHEKVFCYDFTSGINGIYKGWNFAVGYEYGWKFGPLRPYF